MLGRRPQPRQDRQHLRRLEHCGQRRLLLTPLAQPSPCPQANITLYAKWTFNTYTVSYSGNGGTGGHRAYRWPHAYPTGATVTVLTVLPPAARPRPVTPSPAETAPVHGCTRAAATFRRAPPTSRCTRSGCLVTDIRRQSHPTPRPPEPVPLGREHHPDGHGERCDYGRFQYPLGCSTRWTATLDLMNCGQRLQYPDGECHCDLTGLLRRQGFTLSASAGRIRPIRPKSAAGIECILVAVYDAARGS